MGSVVSDKEAGSTALAEAERAAREDARAAHAREGELHQRLHDAESALAAEAAEVHPRPRLGTGRVDAMLPRGASLMAPLPQLHW
jgi:hypothetical protein